MWCLTITYHNGDLLPHFAILKSTERNYTISLDGMPGSSHLNVACALQTALHVIQWVSVCDIRYT